MELVCNRCSATLDPEASYCQNCGSPQIRYAAQQETTNSEQNAGSLTPSRSDLERMRTIYWRTVIRIALVIAIAVGLLSTFLAAGSVLWVGAGAAIAVGMYRRALPNAILGRQAGARIGALVGVLATAIALAGNAVFLLLQRYPMHQGHLIDSQLTQIVTQAAARAGAMDPQAPVSTFTGFWLSPEGRIGLILLTMGFLAVLILLFAIAGGMLGAQMYRGRRKATP